MPIKILKDAHLLSEKCKLKFQWDTTSLSHLAKANKPTKPSVAEDMEQGELSSLARGSWKQHTHLRKHYSTKQQNYMAHSLQSRNPTFGTYSRENLANVHLESHKSMFIVVALSVMETTHMSITNRIENFVVHELETCKWKDSERTMSSGILRTQCSTRESSHWRMSVVWLHFYEVLQ